MRSNETKRARKPKAGRRPAHLEGPCTAFHGGPRVPVTDAGKTVRLLSLSGLYLSKVDGCICKQEVACDYVATAVGAGDVLVELKGSDVDHAVDQIDATLRFWRQNGWLGKVFAGLVVCTRYPRQDTKIQRLRNRFARDYGAPLHVVRHGQEFEFGRVLAMDGPR